MSIPDIKTEEDASLVDILIRQEKTLKELNARAADCFQQKKGSATATELLSDLSIVWKNLSNTSATVPGGLSKGAEISLAFRKELGFVPEEIKSDKELAVISALFNEVAQTEKDLYERLNDKETSDKQDRSNRVQEILLVQNIALTLPLATLGSAALIWGTENKVFLVSVAGTTLIVTAGTTALLLRPKPEGEHANDEGSKAKRISDNIAKTFAAYKTSITSKGETFFKNTQNYATASFSKGKGWLNERVQKIPAFAKRITNIRLKNERKL